MPPTALKSVVRIAVAAECLVLASAAMLSVRAQRQDALEENFRRPPASVKPQTYWLWMNGNVSREGITRDLEAMKAVGIGGVMMFDGGAYLPKGPVGFMNPEWRALMKHAIE